MRKKIVKRKNKRWSKMSLPHTYFWHISKSPIMVYNGRVYNVKPTDSERSLNIIKINDEKYEFEESETLLDLEALYNTDFSKEIDGLKTEFLNNKLKDKLSNHIKWKMKSLDKIKANLEGNHALLIVLQKIIPEIEGKNPIEHVEEYSSTIPKEEISKFKESVSEVERVVLDEKIRKIELKTILVEESFGAIINNQRDRSILGKYILHNFNIIILSPMRMFIFSNKRSADKVDVSGELYNLQQYKEYGSIDSIESSYLDFLENTFNYEALEGVDKTIEGIDEIYKQEALLSNIIKGEEFHGANGGFYRHSNGKFVFYINVPQFINKFPDGDYHLFPACKIAVGCKYDSSKRDFSIIQNEITVLSRYRHPFTSPFKNGNDESNFCTGVYTISRGMKGYEKVPQVLVELKTLLMSGYNAYHRNIDNVYIHMYGNPISKQEAIKRGIPITNEDIVVSEGIKKKYAEGEEDE